MSIPFENVRKPEIFPRGFLRGYINGTLAWNALRKTVKHCVKSVQIRTRKNFVFGHFSRSGSNDLDKLLPIFMVQNTEFFKHKKGHLIKLSINFNL